MADFKQMYKTVMDDHFPDRMIIQFGNQILVYRKRSWKIPDESTGEVIEKGFTVWRETRARNPPSTN